MAEAGHIQFPGSLDPRAEEFRPRSSNHYQPQTCAFYGQTQLYYPYTFSYTPSVGGQAVQFSNAFVGVPYAQPSTVPPPVADYLGNPSVPVAPVVSPSSTMMATRSLLLSSVPCELVSESSLRRELEAFGDVRGVQMDRVRDGMVTVHFYDLRHAEMALKEIQNHYLQYQTRLRNRYNAMGMMSIQEPGIYTTSLSSHSLTARGVISGLPVWAQFVIPAHNAVPGGNNQGTIVVLNLDSRMSSEFLCRIFEDYGSVKEIRCTPSKKNQRFIEYFDVRDAAEALAHLNGKEILGKPVVIQFSRPGGQARKFLNSLNSRKVSTHTSLVRQSYRPRNFTATPAQAPAPLSSIMPFFPRKFSRGLSSNASGPRSSMSQAQVLAGKSNVNEECPNGNGNTSKRTDSGALGIYSKMASLSLAESEVEELLPEGATGEDLKNSRSTQQEQAQHQSRSRSWKGKGMKKAESRYLIKQGTIESGCRDSRTTVMIKNIPNKYSQKLLLSLLDNHCIRCNEQIANGDDQPLSSFDFVYLPIDFNNKCNVGYGFVNMTSPEATLRLYKAFHHQHWEVFNSRKICEVTYARVQGLEALREHFKNSKFPGDMEHYLPVVFMPPRDGKLLTEPTPVVGQSRKQEEEKQQRQQQQKQPNPVGEPDSKVTGEIDMVGNGIVVSDSESGSRKERSDGGGGEVNFMYEIGLSGSCNCDMTTTTTNNLIAMSTV